MANTPEQAAVIEAAAGDESIAMDAVAGSGKTFTLVQAAAAKAVPTLAVAFNKKNATDLQERMPSHVTCMTLNALGGRSLRNFLTASNIKVDTSKIEKLVTEVLKEENCDDQQAWVTVRKLVHAAKNAGLVPEGWSRRQMYPLLKDTPDNWADLIDHFDIEAGGTDIRLAQTVLRKSLDLALQGTIDFPDQLYLSVTMRAPFQKYERLIVDEAQDLSPLQHFMVKQSLRPKGTGISAGDEHQAIYAWRGASSDSIHLLKEQFGARSFPLTYCFRCSEAVVEEAQQEVPHIRVPAGTRRGSVKSLHNWNAGTIPSGSAILCRNNAPLVGMAFRLLRARRGIQMLGRDFGAGLKALIKLSKAKTVEGLLEFLERWEAREIAKAQAKFNFQKADQVSDKADSIRVIADEVSTLDQLNQVLDSLFSKESRDITLSTGHRSKGMEWKEVFFLDPHLLPGKWDLQEGAPEWMLRQALNLRYVIKTRAMDNLNYVNYKDWDKE